jgi:hypothetical protein
MAPLSALLHSLFSGKGMLRRTRRSASLDQKVQALLDAQRLHADIAGSQRPLSPRERPWNIKP